MKYIRVYNTGSKVVLTGLNRQYTIPAGRIGFPSSEDIPDDELQYIASKTDMFRTGRLFFGDDVAKVMELLRIPNWRDTVMTDEMIRDAILHPNYDKIMRILKTTSVVEIDRYRAIMVYIQNSGEIGVSEKVERIIRGRYNELNSGVQNSRIVVMRENFAETDKANDEQSRVLNEKDAEIARLKAMVEALTKNEATAEKTTKPKTTKKKTTTETN